MQTLGISDSTPRSENRLKSLFWPSVQSGADVDYLGTQGFWIAAAIGILSTLFLLVLGDWVGAVLVAPLFLLGAAGIREQSRFAAVVVFVFYVWDMLLTMPAPGGLVVKVIISAALLSNVRATFIAAGWQPGEEQTEGSPRLRDTWTDRLADQLPPKLWPRVRVFYYIFSIIVLGLLALGTMATLQGVE